MMISVVNQKGGVGKTTVAVNLAQGLRKQGYSVVLVDGDPQGSVLQWQSIGGSDSLPVIHHPELFSAPLKRDLLKDHDLVVADSPPALGDLVRSILVLSDLAVIPVGPSPLDIWSSRETLDLVDAARQSRPGFLAALLICRKIPRTRLGLEAREAMEAYGVDILETEICQRIAYVEAMIAGQSVQEYAPSSEAAREADRLCSEIEDRIRRRR